MATAVWRLRSTWSSGVSSLFCSERCQTAWHAARTLDGGRLPGYREPLYEREFQPAPSPEEDTRPDRLAREAYPALARLAEALNGGITSMRAFSRRSQSVDGGYQVPYDVAEQIRRVTSQMQPLRYDRPASLYPTMLEHRQNSSDTLARGWDWDGCAFQYTLEPSVTEFNNFRHQQQVAYSPQVQVWSFDPEGFEYHGERTLGIGDSVNLLNVYRHTPLPNWTELAENAPYPPPPVIDTLHFFAAMLMVPARMFTPWQIALLYVKPSPPAVQLPPESRTRGWVESAARHFWPEYSRDLMRRDELRFYQHQDIPRALARVERLRRGREVSMGRVQLGDRSWPISEFRLHS